MDYKNFILLLLSLNSYLGYSCSVSNEKDNYKTKIDLSGKDLNNEDFSQYHSESIEILILDSCNLITLPLFIQTLTNLRHLSLRYNENIDLPKVLSILRNLDNLTFLNLGNNNITQIPKSFSTLKTLTGLKLSYNNIELKSVSTTLSKMPNLTRLWIDNNQIKVFSSILLTFPKLKFLYAFDNQMDKIDLPKKQSGKLWVLHMGNNQFKELPIQLIDIKNLRMAMFNQNKIESIPDDFNKKKYSMSALILDANPLVEKEKEKAEKIFRKFMMYSD